MDAHDNVYVLHRNESMPIVAFDCHGKSKNGDIFIADSEGPNTRVVTFSKDRKFIK